MHRRRTLHLLAAFAVVAVTLPACSSDSARRPACPSVLVLADAATLTAFVPGRGTDILDVDYEVDIADILSGCEVDRSDRNNPFLTVAVAPVLVVGRGAANQTGTASFSYFVSVVREGNQIANKMTFPVDVAFEGNRNRVVLREDDPPISVNIPLAGGANPFADEVIVGLQLSPDQLEYNQQRRAGVR